MNIRKTIRTAKYLLIIAGLLFSFIKGRQFLPKSFMDGNASIVTKIASEAKETSLRAFFPSDNINRPHQLLVRKNYIVSYNSHTRCPNWVLWQLTREHADGNVKRPDYAFHEDMEVPAPRAELADYRHNGYDRGHMAPAGDMKWDEQAMNETFFLTNVCPQDAALNAGMWNDIEIKVREWARRDKSLIVVTGPIMGNNHETIGQDMDIAVPDAFFKVILSPNTTPKKAIAFICPNRSCGGDLKKYAVSVDEVEKRTGMNFFNTLPDDVENRIESTCNLNQWLNR